MKAYYFKFALIAAAVGLAIVAIWAEENRLKLALTALVLLAAWGIWLGVDRNDPPEQPPAQPIEQRRVDGNGRRGPEHRP